LTAVLSTDGCITFILRRVKCHLLRGRVVVVIIIVVVVVSNWSCSQNCVARSYYTSARGHHNVYFYNRV
jgi:hypothetical protein